MAESVTENGGFTQDLFSPLQFCEVVEEGQQQRQQQLSQQQQQLHQLHQHHAQLNQQLTNLQTSQHNHHSQQPQIQSQNQNQLQHQQQPQHPQQQQPQLQQPQHQQQQHQQQQPQPPQHQPQPPQHQPQPPQHQPQQHQPQPQQHQPQHQPQPHQPQPQQHQSQPQQHQPSPQQHQPPPQQQPQPQSQSQLQSIKQESPQQSLQPQLLSACDSKSQSLINNVASMEIFLSSNPIQLQADAAPLIAIHQQPLSQSMYQVQLTRHQQQTIQQLHLNPIHLQNQTQPQNVQLTQPQNLRPHAQTPVPLSVGIVNVGTSESFVLPAATLSTTKPPLTSAVATQTTPDEGNTLEGGDDEPEIIFTNVSTATAENPSVALALHSNAESDAGVRLAKSNETTSITTNGNIEIKTAPIKRTWRRPWKKKKEREKRQPVKKTRRLKRRRIIVPKKSVIHVDPRHGPPIDTSNTLVERESEDAINQLKQKRQRIKLNRNSGRQYVNRLGKVVRARKIGSPCNCPLKCWDRMGSKILDIFNNFWDLCDFNLQNSYLFTCLKLCDVKRRYTKKPAEESRRQNTFEYFVRISGKHLRVCKKAFMSSHGLTSDKRLRTLFTQMKDGALIPEPDRRGKHLRPSKTPPNGHSNLLTSNNAGHVAHYTAASHQTTKVKQKANRYKKKQAPAHRMDVNKQTMYTPPTHAVTHLHPHCTPPPPPAHGTAMQEPPHAYIPNGDIYFPGHYLEPPQAMAPPHMNQIPSCQKMLETPAYFMAGMKENTFHQ